MTRLFLIILTLFVFQSTNSQTQFFGMTPFGGEFESGTIYKTDSAGNNQSIQYNFLEIEGATLFCAELIQATDGKLYGLTASGGINGNGVLFQYDPASDIYRKKFEFNSAVSGESPYGGLMQASNGKLYGMTYAGGVNNKGVIFEYDPVGEIYTKLLDFDGVLYGAYPKGTLMQASDGLIYGMTSFGGTSNFGILFQLDPSTNILTKKIDFNGATNGSGSMGKLMQANDGKLYGLTCYGGVNNSGTIFQYDITSSVLIKKIDFGTTATGSNPFASLIQAANGMLYGTSEYGGTYNKGTIFQFDPITNAFTKKYDFIGGVNGYRPNGTLIQDADGTLYGLTLKGGTSDYGVLFQFDATTSTYTQKKDFNGVWNGQTGNGALLKANDNKLYGVTISGGTGSLGTLFQYDPSVNVLTKKIDFGISINGNKPAGSLMQASNKKLYGMTTLGGSNGMGTLFQYDVTTKGYTKKIDFTGTANGANPSGSLIEASDGKLYGMTNNGGINNMGVIFQYDPATSVYVKKTDFDGIAKGKHSFGSLLQANDGKLYGMTYYGGTNNEGVLFQYNPITNAYVKKIDFNGGALGANPLGSLIQASDGKLYGVASNGGANNKGVLFQYNIVTNAYVKKVDFSTSDGFHPCGTLVQAPDGKLYGTCKEGGVNGMGILFQFDPVSNICSKKIDFAGITNGMAPSGALMVASNGMLYGATTMGGINNKGVLYQYDPVNNVFTKRLDFNGVNGYNHYYNHLIELTLSVNTGTVNTNRCTNNTFYLQYTATGAFDSGNSFNVELSDVTGSFASPVIIGTETIYSGGIMVTIPLSILPGSGYRIRVVSTLPVIKGNDNGTDIDLEATPVLSVNSGTICSGQSFTIIPTGAISYTYSSGTAIVSPTVNNTYLITGASNGCISSVISTVAVNSKPLVTVNSGSICAGQTFTIVPNGADTYTISGGSFHVNPITSTSYSITGTDYNGCSNLFPTICNLIVNQLPVITASTNNTLLCAGETATLSVNGTGTYEWNTNESTSSIIVSPDTTTSYTVVVTDNLGCSATSVITQSVSVCLDINELNNNTGITISPNPSNGLLIVSANSHIKTIEVLNLTGQLLVFESVNDISHQLSLDAFADGVYFVRVIYGNGDFLLQKVIVSR